MGFNSGFKGLILYGEIIAVCSEIHTKHINTLCGQGVQFVNVKLVVHIVTTGLSKGFLSNFHTGQRVVFVHITRY